MRWVLVSTGASTITRYHIQRNGVFCMARQTKLTKRRTKEPRVWYPLMCGVWVSDRARLRPRGRQGKERGDG